MANLKDPSWLAGCKIKEVLENQVADLGLIASDIQVEHPFETDFGDYSSNFALVNFKNNKLKGVNSPFELALLIVDNINVGQYDFLKKIEAVKPGFINFHLSEKYLISQAKQLLKKDQFKKKLAEIGRGKTMVIDYSAPNIAKPFGIGHLRSTNIGQAVYNLYEILGWQTIGDNHLGDWGTQFGKLIVAIKKWWEKSLDKLTISELEKLYVKFHQEAEKNPKLEQQARDWFKKLEEQDKQAMKLWEKCVQVSMKEFNRVYELLGVEIDHAFGESFYYFESWMDKVISDLKEKGLIKSSRGAQVVEVEGFDTPAMVLKSDGATTYLTRDLATIKFRKQEWDPDLIVYEVGADHKFHFNQVFAVADNLGYFDTKKLVHIPHGMISLKSGKLSTRKGKTIHLKEVLTQAIDKAKKLVTAEDLTKEQRTKIARAVGIGAVKFNDLKQEPQKDIVFDWEQILSVDGYSGPYLQYSLARAKSVLNKSEKEIRPGEGYQSNQEELALLKSFYQFPEVVLAAARNFGPHFVCQYLFDLSQKFNLFYQKHRILDVSEDEAKEFRLFLTQVFVNILEIGLNILGIEVLEKM